MKRITRGAVIEALVQTIADEQHGGDPYDIADAVLDLMMTILRDVPGYKKRLADVTNSAGPEPHQSSVPPAPDR